MPMPRKIEDECFAKIFRVQTILNQNADSFVTIVHGVFMAINN